MVVHWHEILRPGGKVVLAQRTRSSSSDNHVQFKPHQVEQLVDRVGRDAMNQPNLDLSVVELQERVRRYANNFHSYAVRDLQALKQMFLDAGFALDTFLTHHMNTDNKYGESSPSLPNNAEFVQLVARRRTG